MGERETTFKICDAKTAECFVENLGDSGLNLELIFGQGACYLRKHEVVNEKLQRKFMTDNRVHLQRLFRKISAKTHFL